MSGNSSKMIALNYFGGKFTIVDKLIEYFPSHIHFVDCFCGTWLHSIKNEITCGQRQSRNVSG